MAVLPTVHNQAPRVPHWSIAAFMLCVIANIVSSVELDFIPTVMLGYDVVAYHLNVTGCASIKGKREYSHILSSADENGINRLYNFWFAAENNKNIFISDPWKYG